MQTNIYCDDRKRVERRSNVLKIGQVAASAIMSRAPRQNLLSDSQKKQKANSFEDKGTQELQACKVEEIGQMKKRVSLFSRIPDDLKVMEPLDRQRELDVDSGSYQYSIYNKLSCLPIERKLAESQSGLEASNISSKPSKTGEGSKLSVQRKSSISTFSLENSACGRQKSSTPAVSIREGKSQASRASVRELCKGTLGSFATGRVSSKKAALRRGLEIRKVGGGRVESARIRPSTHEVWDASYSSEALDALLADLRIYAPRANYLTQNSGLSWRARASLVSWASALSAACGFSRHTFYVAVNFFDRFSSQKTPSEAVRGRLMLGCVRLAAKTHERGSPLLSRLKTLADESGIEALNEIEVEILLTLEFFLSPPTLPLFADFLTDQWDRLVESQTFDSELTEVFPQGAPLFRGKSLLQQLFLILDTVLMTSQSLQYNSLALVSSASYLLLLIETRKFSLRRVSEEFPYASDFLTEKEPFNQLLKTFLKDYLGVELIMFLPTIQFVSNFVKLLEHKFEWGLSEEIHVEEQITRHVNHEESLIFLVENSKMKG